MRTWICPTCNHLDDEGYHLTCPECGSSMRPAKTESEEEEEDSYNDS